MSLLDWWEHLTLSDSAMMVLICAVLMIAGHLLATSSPRE